MNDVPVIFISALEKQRIFKAIDIAMDIFERRSQKIKTSVLNEFLEQVTAKLPPPAHRGKFINIKYGTQLPLAYPAFAFFCNYPTHIKPSYKQYLENQMRLKFNFKGVPISIFFRKS